MYILCSNHFFNELNVVGVLYHLVVVASFSNHLIILVHAFTLNTLVEILIETLTITIVYIVDLLTVGNRGTKFHKANFFEVL